MASLPSARALALAVSTFGLVLAGCGDDSETTSSTSSSAGSGGGDGGAASSGGGDSTTAATATSTASAGTTSGAGGEGGQGGQGAGGDGAGGSNPIETIATAEGSLTITFTSESDPGVDCTATYEIAGVEDRSVPWLFPAADIAFVAPADVSSSTCDPPSDWVLRIGWNADGELFYAPEDNIPLPVGTATVAGDTVTLTVDYAFDYGDDFDLAISGDGTLSLGTTEDDPLHGFRRSETYSCGWPRTDPPPFDGDYAAEEGDPLPDGVFLDACGDNVRLLDLTGRYLVLLGTTADDSCSPCTAMRNGIGLLEDTLAGLDVETLTVSMLVESLFDADAPASPDALAEWEEASGTNGVVLADRSFVGAHVCRATDYPYLAFPGWMVVAPDGTILEISSGYSPNDTPDYIATLIESDAAN